MLGMDTVTDVGHATFDTRYARTSSHGQGGYFLRGNVVTVLFSWFTAAAVAFLKPVVYFCTTRTVHVGSHDSRFLPCFCFVRLCWSTAGALPKVVQLTKCAGANFVKYRNDRYFSERRCEGPWT